MPGSFSGNRWFYEPNIYYVCIPTCAQIWKLCNTIPIQTLLFLLFKISFILWLALSPSFQCVQTLFFFSSHSLFFCPHSFCSNSFCLSNLRTIQALIYIQLSALRQMPKTDTVSWSAISKIPELMAGMWHQKAKQWLSTSPKAVP